MELDKAALDRYITQSPHDDGFESFCELVADRFSDDFWEENENWILENEVSIRWHEKLLNRMSHYSSSPSRETVVHGGNMTIIDAAKIIQRAHSIYIDGRS